MKSKTLAALFILLLAKSALAKGGSDVGNGGNTIVCENAKGQIQSVELLDFYEAKVKRNVTPSLGDPTLTVDQKIELTLKRLDPISPKNAEELRKMTKSFQENAAFLPGIRLTTIDDSNQLFVPAGCQQEQTAIQRTPEFPGDKLYNIDQDLWNLMDSDSRAGLILHEVFYRFAIEAGHPTDSVPVRFFVSSLTSEAGISAELFVSVLRPLGFYVANILVNGMEFNFLITHDLGPDFENGFLHGGPIYKSPMNLQGKALDIDAIYFYPDGRIQAVEGLEPIYLNFQGQNVWIAPKTWISFNAEGQIIGATLLPTETMHLVAQGKYDLNVVSNGSSPVDIGFLENGSLYNCTACIGTAILGGQSLDVSSSGPRSSYFRFNDHQTMVYLAHPTTFKYFGHDLQVEAEFIYDDDNRIESAQLTAPLTLPVGGTNVTFAEGPIGFLKADIVNGGILAEDATLLDANGVSTPFRKGMFLHFDLQGQVISARIPDSK